MEADGDFDEFYAAYRLTAMVWIRHKEPSWDEQTCEDVAGEAWAALYANVGRVRHARAYLYTTLNTKINDERRRRRTRAQPHHAPPEHPDPRADPEGIATLPAVLAQIQAELREVLDAVHDLPEAWRDAYVLRVGVHRLSSTEIAQIVGCSAAAVDVRVARARHRLRTRFGADRLTQFENVTRRTG